MSAPLLVTKLYKPIPRTDWIGRPQLIRKMDEGLMAKLILVSAPAGFGKSSIICAWLDHIELPSTWFSIDVDDNDMNRFLSYLIEAIRVINPAFGKSIFSALQSTQLPDISSFLPYMIDDLIDTGDCVLVLDDFHLIKNHLLHEFIDSLVKYAPPSFHLLLSTRSDPSIQLTYYRAKQLMIEIRTDDLRFTAADTSRLMKQKIDGAINDKTISVLNQRTEGWISGLQMALLSMQHVEDKESYVDQFSSSNRYILDYLLDEVLSHQPHEIRDFLLRTAFLPKLSASLCSYVSGNSNAQEILEQLEKENLFTIALDDNRQCYRYHHLFSDLLQQQALSSDDIPVPSIHLKASQWYREHEEPNQAVEFALLAGDFPQAIAVLDIPGTAAISVFGLLSLEKYLDQLPYELVQNYPNLLMGYAWVYLASSRPELVEHHLNAVENWYGLNAEKVASNKSQPAAVCCLLAELQIIRGNVNVHQSNFGSVVALCEQAKQYLNEDVKEYSIAQYEVLWSLLAFNFALAYEYLGELVQAEQNFQTCIDLSKKYNNFHLIPVATSHLAQIQRARGNLNASLNTYNEAVQYTEKSELPASPLAGIAFVGLGHLYYEMNRLDEAETVFLQGLELAKLWHHWESINSAYYGLACVYLARGLWDKVDEQLRQLRDCISEIDSPWGRQRILAQVARISIHRGDIFEIRKWVDEFKPLLSDEIIYSHVFELLVYARAQINLLNYEEGKRIIDFLCQQCEQKHWVEYQIQCLIIHSILLGELHSTDQSVYYMKTALSLAKVGGYMRLFLDEFSFIKAMLKNLTSDDAAGRITLKLLDCVENEIEDKRKQENLLNDPNALSDREIEVLIKIAEGVTNQRAAFDLHIAEGTIKNHLKSIFSKLHASTRTQAIMIAREKGYLD